MIFYDCQKGSVKESGKETGKEKKKKDKGTGGATQSGKTSQ